MNVVPYPQFDFSAGVQDATTFLLKKPNELQRGINVRFTEELGGFERRPGFAREGNQFSTAPNLPDGGHAAKFTTGTVRMVAVNNNGNTATIIRTQNPDGTWTTLSGISYPKDAIIFFKDYMDQVFVSGFDPATGDPVTPYNIDKTLNVSATRNLLNAPTGYFFEEYLGVLYMANLKYGGIRYPGRVQKASPPLSFLTSVQGAQSGTLTVLSVDSVRYIKPGNAIDVYAKGTENKLYDLTVTAVDKFANTISFASTSVTVTDNDEIWLDGTKDTPTNIFWNTDYPNIQSTGEFLDIKPGKDASNVISGIAQSSNRLFIFTKNSGSRYDGNNLVVFNNSVGCISHRSLANIDDDWLIWLDARGNIRARNESGGQQEKISRPVRSIIRKFTQEQLKAANAGVVDQTYKLFLGTNADGEYVRVCYDFEANTWSPEKLGYPALIQFNDATSGNLLPYFLSNNGRLYVDETGNMDDDKTIEFLAGTGQDLYNNPQVKNYYGILLFTENCSGLKIEGAVDGGQMKTIGKVDGKTCWIKFNENSENQLQPGRTFDWQIVGAEPNADPPRMRGAVVFYSIGENIPTERRPGYDR